MKKKKMTNVQLIINELLSGKALNANEISEMVMASSGTEIEPRNVSSMLSKISQPIKCNLGFFIQRKREGISFVYQMVEASLELSEDQAYGLTLKMGKECYTLEQAVEDYPQLAEYVKSVKPVKSKVKVKAKSKLAEKKAPPKKRAAKKVSAKKAPAKKVAKVANVPAVRESSDMSVEKLAAQLIQKVDELGGLKLNVSVSFKLDGLGD